MSLSITYQPLSVHTIVAIGLKHQSVIHAHEDHATILAWTREAGLSLKEQNQRIKEVVQKLSGCIKIMERSGIANPGLVEKSLELEIASERLLIQGLYQSMRPESSCCTIA